MATSSSSSIATKGSKKWFPLESNPAVMNTFLAKMGFDTSKYALQDVLSTEEWALAMIPRPCVAVVMLFPIKDASEAFNVQEAEKIDAQGQVLVKSLYYTKQTIGNACGTIGLLHAVANAGDDINCILPHSFLESFLTQSRGHTPEDIAAMLEADEELEKIHGHSAQEGQSQVKALDTPLNTHFICFSVVEGQLYELDGRKKSAIHHGPSSRETLLEDAVTQIQKFMQRDPGEVRFTILALAKVEA